MAETNSNDYMNNVGPKSFLYDFEEQSPTGGQYTYKKYGFIQSRHHGANITALNIELNKIYESYKNKIRQDDVEQEKLKHPIRIKLSNLQVEKEQNLKRIDILSEKRIPRLEGEINQIKNEISEIKRNPQEHYGDKPNRIAYVIGLVVLVVLTIYLWIFYTSAGYSAFFRNFKADELNVANSIFDAKAIINAWNDGVPAFVLVVSMPFIFLGLGYLIHKYMKLIGFRKYLSLGLLIAVTFIFDYIIAYEIVKKIYDLKAAGSMDQIPEYSFKMAIVDINFWLIIFAGFVTYLIWGFLFDKLMFDHDQFDIVRQKVIVREKQIVDLKAEIEKENEKIDKLIDRDGELTKEIKVCEQDLTAVFINPKDFEHIIFQFSSGWMQFIEGGLLANDERKNQLRVETDNVIKKFISDNSNQRIYEPII